MAGKKDNIKALFSNTKTRTIILFTGVLLVSVIVFGFLRFFSASSTTAAPQSSSTANQAANKIRSIPGALNQTAEYAALQEEQNIQQAQQAKKTGSSSIPTIIRTQAFGEGVGLIGPKNGEGAVGFTTLALADNAGPQQSLWTQDLKKDECNQITLKRIISEGAVVTDLYPACSCAQLKDNGYTLKELILVCSCREMKAAGYGAADMKSMGYTAKKLKQCGYSACETRGSGFSAPEMKEGGYSDGELQGAGFSDQDITKAGGIPDGITAEDIRKAGCNVDSLKRLREQGVSAAAIVKVSGCSLAQLKAAGYTVAELKAAGFTAAQLKNAGFSAAELKAAEFDPRELLNAGFSSDDLKQAGFSDKDIASADSTLPPGMTFEQIQKAGCSTAVIQRETLAGVSPGVIAKVAGCTEQAIKNAGCDVIKLRKLREAGITAKQIHDLNGCSAEVLKAAGFMANELTDAGFSPQALQALGLKAVGLDEIKAAGCDPEKLKKLTETGISAKQLHELNGCSVSAIKAAGLGASALADAGFTPAELLASGFTGDELNRANLIPAGVIATGRSANCSVDALKAARAAGVTAKTIKETLGCSAAAMRAAGFTAAELKAAGFSAAELKAAGFTDADLRAAGFGVSELKAAGLTAAQLKATGFRAAELKTAGFSVSELKAAGLSAAELKAAGFNEAEMASVGFGPAEPNQETVSSDTGLASHVIPQFTGFNQAASKGPLTATQIQTKELQKIMSRQQKQQTEQRYQAQIKQKSGTMMSAAKEVIQNWKKSPTQVFVGGSKKENSDRSDQSLNGKAGSSLSKSRLDGMQSVSESGEAIKTGDILFAVMDTSVNTDEPGPILATIVSGRLKGSKLIGSFTLPSNASKMVILFNTLSIPGKDKTVSISAYAIDPNTARTALSSETNHHYMQRYGALFASSFMAGMSSAIQSANTTVSVGGTGGNTNTTVSTLSRSTLDNTLIALGEVGKAWSKTAQRDMNRPTTVEVYAGTGLGILFTQDVLL